MFTIRTFSTFSRVALASGAFLLSVAAGCTYSHGDPDPTPQPCEVSAQNVTYSGVISPIFDANCRSCHSTSGAPTVGGGNDFGSYQAINRFPSAVLLGSIEHAPGADPMPKGGAKLSACDIERIKAWIAAGKPNN